MKRCYVFALPALLLLVTAARAADHRVEVLEEGPPSEALSNAVASELAGQGLRVVRGSNRTVCDLWLRDKLPVRSDFTPTLSELYPFEVGELIGVVRYHRDGEDFRAQEIPAGVYTLRYALQPVDGNHIGTSDTRDFLLLIKAEDDTDAANMDEMAMWNASAEAIGTSHPAMLSMLPAMETDAELPSMEHNEEFDQWSVRFRTTSVADGSTDDMLIRLIVVGHSPE